MKVKLIASTNEPVDVMRLAARTCYSEKSPIELWDKRYNEKVLNHDVLGVLYKHELQEVKWQLVKKVLDSGHLSIAEHVNFTFAIEGISRACSHQLVRHRLCTFSQQSQRYVEIKEDLTEIKELYLQTCSSNPSTREKATAKVTEIVDKYFIRDNDKIGAIKYYLHLMDYLQAIHDDCKPEEARMLLPNATKTNIILTTNLRNLIHMAELRLCFRAQKEIRELFDLIKKEIPDQRISNLLQKQCDRLGYCPEGAKTCGYKSILN